MVGCFWFTKACVVSSSRLSGSDSPLSYFQLTLLLQQLVSTPQRATLVQSNTMLAHTPKSTHLVAIEPPNQWSTTVRKRQSDYIDSDYSDRFVMLAVLMFVCTPRHQANCTALVVELLLFRNFFYIISISAAFEPNCNIKVKIMVLILK